MHPKADVAEQKGWERLCQVRVRDARVGRDQPVVGSDALNQIRRQLVMPRVVLEVVSLCLEHLLLAVVQAHQRGDEADEAGEE